MFSFFFTLVIRTFRCRLNQSASRSIDQAIRDGIVGAELGFEEKLCPRLEYRLQSGRSAGKKYGIATATNSAPASGIGPALSTSAGLSPAMWIAVILTPIQMIFGDMHGRNTLEYQPIKAAAIEGDWETRGNRLSCSLGPTWENNETIMPLKSRSSAA
jgi:Cytochrome bd terminal oxidase subunit I